MLKCGLLGKKLGHSYSPVIHSKLSDYEYLLYEKDETQVEDFIKHGDYAGLNVTIPYKKTVFPLLDEVSETAKKVGSVNTIVKKQGKIYGDNTDVYGFSELVRHSGISVDGKKTLVLGNGGAAAAVVASLEALGAKVVVISRRGENNYENLYLHKDAKIIVNTTPLGMYPENGTKAVDLSDFDSLDAVYDIVYNPKRTAILLQAEALGIPFFDGLYMLVAQAKRASELFEGTVIPDEKTDEIYRDLTFKMQNIVLIGMPGVGKSTVAKKLGEVLDREIIDTDEEIEKLVGRKPSEIITDLGEEEFRKIESEVLCDIGKRSGVIIATGGGVVTRERNYPFLHQNGSIVWLKRDVKSLSTDGRPLSQKMKLEEMYKIREPLYKKFADVIIELEKGVIPSEEIIEKTKEKLR